MIKRIIRTLSAGLLSAALLCGPAFSETPPRPESASTSERAWPWILGAYGATIVADAHSTHLALGRGATEVGVPYRWLDDDYVPPARVALGAVAIYGLHSLHKSRPRLAKTIAVVATIATGAVALHNYHVADRLND